jgi:hypothetical protein
MTRLSCHRFRSNEVRLWLSVIDYNLDGIRTKASRRRGSFLVEDQNSLDRGEAFYENCRM